MLLDFNFKFLAKIRTYKYISVNIFSSQNNTPILI